MFLEKMIDENMGILRTSLKVRNILKLLLKHYRCFAEPKDTILTAFQFYIIKKIFP